MDRQIDPEELEAAWRALAGESGSEGWRTISIADQTRCRILAGRHFPGNEEAVLVGFSSVCVTAAGRLPAGHGFAVNAVDLGVVSRGCSWIGLVRQPAGRSDFFAMMAKDVVSALRASCAEERELLDLFLGRVRAWQSFMERDTEGVLSAEAELGLHGELVVLYSLLHSGLSHASVVRGWYGPLNGIHDFRFPTGAIEVKATATVGAFPATISSLEQLDDSLINALFLAGVRFRLDPAGENLPQRVDRIRQLLQPDLTVLAAFDTRLLHAGFFPALSGRYSRAFIHQTTTIFRVEDGFPKITHGSVHRAIRKARYEIDLNLIDTTDISLSFVLPQLGAL
jgi:hypothetical protein